MGKRGIYILTGTILEDVSKFLGQTMKAYRTKKQNFINTAIEVGRHFHLEIRLSCFYLEFLAEELTAPYKGRETNSFFPQPFPVVIWQEGTHSPNPRYLC